MSWLNEEEAARAAAMNQVIIDGDFNCQTPMCDEYVAKAVYLPEVRVLTWKCTKNHKSFIEDINLG